MSGAEHDATGARIEKGRPVEQPKDESTFALSVRRQSTLPATRASSVQSGKRAGPSSTIAAKRPTGSRK